MDWYITKLVFQICSGNGEHQSQFDEQLRLVQAADWHQALLKAQALGIKEACQFQNHQQQAVQWKFVNVTELTCMGSLEDGKEVYYQIAEPDDVNLYLRKVQQQALQLGSNPLMHIS